MIPLRVQPGPPALLVRGIHLIHSAVRYSRWARRNHGRWKLVGSLRFRKDVLPLQPVPTFTFEKRSFATFKDVTYRVANRGILK